MTREEAKGLLPIIQAFAEGKTIEVGDNIIGWTELNNPTFDLSLVSYRIKPEPKYRPFKTKEECWQEMLKHQPFGWVKNEYSNIFNIIIVCENSLQVNEHNMNYSEFYKRFKFIDGTPFGIKEDLV